MTVISETGDEVLRRFLWMLRRWWWLPALLASILGGGILLLQERSFQGTLRFYPVGNSPTLEAAEMDPALLSELVPISADADAVEGAAVRAKASKAAGGSVRIRASVLDNARLVRVVVTGPSPDAVEAARKVARDAFTDRRTERVASAVQSAAVSLEATKAGLEALIASLDERLATAESAAGVLLVERSELTGHLADANAKLEALRQVVSKPDEIVQVAGGGDVEPVGGRTISALAAAMFGVLVGLGVIYLAAFRDRSIRSRRDVAGAVPAEVLALIPERGGEAATGRLAAILASTVDAHGSACVDLVPADRQTTVDPLVGALAADPALRHVAVTGRGHLDIDPGSVHGKDPCVVIARYGTTSRDELEDTLDDLRFGERDVVGVVIVDVPLAALDWANRRPPTA